MLRTFLYKDVLKLVSNPDTSVKLVVALYTDTKAGKRVIMNEIIHHGKQ